MHDHLYRRKEKQSPEYLDAMDVKNTGNFGIHHLKKNSRSFLNLIIYR